MIGFLLALQLTSESARRIPPLYIPPVPTVESPQISSTADLLRVCGENLKGSCFVYIEGVVQGVQMMREASGAKDALYCAGDATTYDAMRAVVAYAELHPDVKESAAATVALALRERWPCAK